MAGTIDGMSAPQAPISAQLAMLAHAAGARLSRTAPSDAPPPLSSKIPPPPETAGRTVTEEPDDDHPAGDRAGMQADRAIAEAELRFEEGDDVALDVEEIGEHPQHQVAVPGGAVARHRRPTIEASM